MGTAAVITAVSELISVGLQAIAAANQATQTLKQAQAENWLDGDPRWTAAFASLDAALKAAQARLT